MAAFCVSGTWALACVTAPVTIKLAASDTAGSRAQAISTLGHRARRARRATGFPGRRSSRSVVMCDLLAVAVSATRKPGFRGGEAPAQARDKHPYPLRM